ncbi:MAG: N4-gp56 family major capsid protein [Ruminococcaceae bacterium]|nr:N4-gp56 family major capsid protein [Oscillospiraceae bacterium]
MKKIFDLQFFADTNADYVVNATGGTMQGGVITDPNALSAEMKTFYDKTLIYLAGPKLIHAQFGQKRPIPANNGKTIEFRRFSKLPKALKPITEGVTPAGNKLRVSAVTATVDQYGDYIEQTDMLEMTSVDNTILEATRELADQAALTLDTVIRNEIVGGTNVYYVPEVNGSTETEILSRADITANCRLRVKDVFRIAAALKAVNAPKINGSYIAIIHAFVANDLMMEAGDKWIEVNKYASPENIFEGELGKLGGIRFVESSEAKIIGPAVISDGLSRLTVAEKAASGATAVKVNEVLTAATPVEPIEVYVNGVKNTVTKIEAAADGTTLTLGTALSAAVEADSIVCGTGAGKDGSAVFCTLFLGENAYGVTDIEGGGLEHIVKQKGYGNDPLNQRSSIGWKATETAKRLIEEYMIRCESGSEFSAVAESN